MNTNKRPESWPFYFMESGLVVQEGRFYGFGDSGSIGGSFIGYPTREEAVNAISKQYDISIDEIGTTKDELGDRAVTVLSGREFIDQLYVICSDAKGELDPYNFGDYGHWEGIPPKQRNHWHPVNACD